MLSLDVQDTFLEVEPSWSAPLAQTASLGLKQSAVRWLPSAVHPLTGGALAIAGSWDEPGQNELSVWSVSLSATSGPGVGADGDAQMVGDSGNGLVVSQLKYWVDF